MSFAVHSTSIESLRRSTDAGASITPVAPIRKRGRPPKGISLMQSASSNINNDDSRHKKSKTLSIQSAQRINDQSSSNISPPSPSPIQLDRVIPSEAPTPETPTPSAINVDAQHSLSTTPTQATHVEARHSPSETPTQATNVELSDFNITSDAYSGC